ncbi:MAG: hypothetical protein R3C14_32100 [Caldilineaceae bacterium]
MRGIGEAAAFFGGGILIEVVGFASFFRATAVVLAIGLIFFLAYFRPLTRVNGIQKETILGELP